MRDAHLRAKATYRDERTGVRIARVASVHPAFRVTQDDAIAELGHRTGEFKRLAALARGSAIRGRAVVLPPGQLLELKGAGARSEIYWAEAPKLALQAACKVLGKPRKQIACIATSSCTGYHLPGLGVELQSRLGLDDDIQRIPLTDPGCAGGVVAMTLAASHITSQQGAAALAVAVELCSLSLQFDVNRGSMTAALIFGDGAGAALLEQGPGRGLDIFDGASHLIPGTQSLLGYELTDTGFSPVLERELVDVLPSQMQTAVMGLLARNGLQPSDISAWLLHPGGARILHEVGRCLALPEGSTRWSWDSMGEYGNTSSAAIFDVLRRYLDDGPIKGEWAVIAGFGPGVAIELLLVRAC